MAAAISAVAAARAAARSAAAVEAAAATAFIHVALNQSANSFDLGAFKLCTVLLEEDPRFRDASSNCLEFFVIRNSKYYHNFTCGF